MNNKGKSLQDMPATVGWREWVALPDLGIPAIKAKFDTGARTSSLHTFFVEPYEENGDPMVRFGVHPLQRRDDIIIVCHSKVIDRRWTIDTGGRRENRYVIGAELIVGKLHWPIEINLANREDMRFRFLVGRTAMLGMLKIDPARSYVMGKKLRESYPPGTGSTED